MIPTLDTSLIDLGKDQNWITDSRHAMRQAATVNHILRAFYGSMAERRELQVLADEVGMGKTFVALAAAFTILSILRDATSAREWDELSGCYRCVLVITPGGNPTLAHKWDKEGEALLERCSCDKQKTAWFQSLLCSTTDQLLQAVMRADDLRRHKAPVILVAQSNIFTKRLSDPAVRFITACLFRWWAKGLQKRERYYVIRGLSETSGSWYWRDAAQWAGCGEYDIQLWDWAKHEQFLAAGDRERENWDPAWERNLFSEVSITYADVEIALNRFSRNDANGELEALRQLCKAVPRRRPGDRRTAIYVEWLHWFYKLKDDLRDVFKQLWPFLLHKQFPLVITDEAHHWRNNDAGDFRSIRQFIAPFSRRLLLLTATPFQLDPREMISVLNVIDHMGNAIGEEQVKSLQRLRERLATCLEASDVAGRAFSKEWGSLADQMARWDAKFADAKTILPGEDENRTEAIRKLWSERDSAEVPGPLRPFFHRTEELRQANQALQKAMRPLVIRHRRDTQHRLYWVGREFPPTAGRILRPDQNQLHLEAGQALEPKDELVQYLLMKVVAELSRGRHRTALGTALTGCYSTLWASKEGRAAVEAAKQGNQQVLLTLLQRLTGKGSNAKDERHPKLRKVVDEVLQRWDRGEKSLIFCFRVRTAEALAETLTQRIANGIKGKRAALFKARGTEVVNEADRLKAMQQFRRTLTAREGSGVLLFLDRVLVGWLLRNQMPVPSITEQDIREVASLASRSKLKGRIIFPNIERPDKVFLQRALEHVWARRLMQSPICDVPTSELIQQMAQESWVCDRYGQRVLSTVIDADDSEPAERAARSSLAAHYDLDSEADAQRQLTLAEEFLSRHRSSRVSVLESLVSGPNLFASQGKSLDCLDESNQKIAAQLRDRLFAITRRDGQWDWAARRDAVDAVIRALLRDDILLRLPIGVFRGQDETWADSLFAGTHKPVNSDGTGETLAQRVVAFLQELERMSNKERQNYLAYAMNPRAEAVALVTGKTDTESRIAIFGGFNTPLLPEILICTAVGQEGIDLHRECRHVIHYDLGWNPATLEQRTGRADRIGSKVERERKLEANQTDHCESRQAGLDVALPYLAGTYDERMFEKLRTRAQVFEILTGGDPTADRTTETLWLETDDEGTESTADFVPLPKQMLESLRVQLEVEQNGKPVQ